MAKWHGKDPSDPKPIGIVDSGTLLSVFPEGTFAEHRAPKDLNDLLDAMLEDPSLFGTQLIERIRDGACLHLRRLPGYMRVKQVPFIEKQYGDEELFELTVRRSFYDEAVVASIQLEFVGRMANSRLQITPDLIEQISQRTKKAVVLVPNKTAVHFSNGTLDAYRIRMGENYHHASVTRDVQVDRVKRRVHVRMESGYVASNRRYQNESFRIDKPGIHVFDFRTRIKDEYAVLHGLGLITNPFPKKVEPTSDLRKTSGLYQVIFYPTRVGLYMLNCGPEIIPLFFNKK